MQWFGQELFYKITDLFTYLDIQVCQTLAVIFAKPLRVPYKYFYSVVEIN